MRPFRLLFSGYAPVHVICFRPLYERLREVEGIEVWFSGGRESKDAGGKSRYDAAGLYRDLDVPRDRVLTLDEMRRRTFDLAFSSHTSGFFPRRRCTRVQIFHGVSFRNMSIREKQKEVGYDAFFMVGPYMRRGFRRRGILPSGDRRALEIGFPKLDRLVDGSLDRAALLGSLGLKSDRPVLLYAPTGAVGNSLETMGEEVIARLKAEDRYTILVKPHDHPKIKIDWFKRLARFEGPRVRVVRDFDVVPYLHAADLLISDASSVASEYSLLDRPIVFLDVPRVIATAKRKGTMVDLKTYGRRTGITVRKPVDVADTVKWFLRHPGYRGSVRRAMAKDLFYDPGHATDRAVEWVLRKLSRRAGRTLEAAVP